MLGYLVFGVSVAWFLVEGRLLGVRRTSARPRFLQNRRPALWGALMLAAASVGPVDRLLGRSPPPPSLALAGAALVVAGVALRTVAICALGSAFSFTVGVDAGQRLVRTGVYRRLRHPSYAAAVLAFTGCELATGSWLGLGAVMAFCALYYPPRIAFEERELSRAFPEYAAYQRESWRLLPFLY